MNERIFDATYGTLTALGRKQRATSFIVICGYCEGIGYDIFDKQNDCPICDGVGLIVDADSYESDT